MPGVERGAVYDALVAPFNGRMSWMMMAGVRERVVSSFSATAKDKLLCYGLSVGASDTESTRESVEKTFYWAYD